MFELHPQLAADSIVVGDFPLSRLLLLNDSQYPWFVLVPRRQGITELFELADADQLQLHQEIMDLARGLKEAFVADKMNIAALGNMVSQLHVHIIVRYRDDPAWPAPVWGKVAASPYRESALQERLNSLKTLLKGDFVFAEARQ